MCYSIISVKSDQAVLTFDGILMTQPDWKINDGQTTGTITELFYLKDLYS